MMGTMELSWLKQVDAKHPILEQTWPSAIGKRT